MKIQFPYLTTLGLGQGEMAFRPSLEIAIHASGKRFVQMAIVDSGSDISLMNYEVAEFFAIDLTRCKKTNVGGVTGKGIGYLTSIGITVEGFKKEITTPVVFIKDLNTGILLGQTGFFEKFKIIFERKKRVFTLEENI